MTANTTPNTTPNATPSQRFLTAHALTRLVIAKDGADGATDYRATFGACLRETSDLTGAWVRRLAQTGTWPRDWRYTKSALEEDWDVVRGAIKAQRALIDAATAADAAAARGPRLSGEPKAQAILAVVRSAGNVRQVRRWTKGDCDRLYVTAGVFQAHHRTITIIIDIATGDVDCDYEYTNRRFRSWGEALEEAIGEI